MGSKHRDTDVRDGSLLVVGGGDVQSILSGREKELLEVVKLAYLAHGRGDSSLPQSLFLRFPGDEASRIIALPAYLGGDFNAAGMKWVSSFPANLDRGLDRASAVVTLNSAETGRPYALLEGSIISAKRTAASAALAAGVLSDGTSSVSVVGCGVINFEIVRFLRVTCPAIRRLCLFDLNRHRAELFLSHCEAAFPDLDISIEGDIEGAFARSSLISFATTATVPHVSDLSACRAGAVILHVSLRDLVPEIILEASNVVDDVEHVCRAQTSIHLAEQRAGNRDFITCTLADLLRGNPAARMQKDKITIFSPFGLGVLDIAVATLVQALAARQGIGTVIESFLPDSWVESNRQ